MTNTASAKKRVRRDSRKTMVNSGRRNRIKTFIKKVEATIDDGDKQAAVEALREAQPEIMRGVSRGIVKKNTASRKISRLSKRIKSI